jgi:hypothetical protein
MPFHAEAFQSSIASGANNFAQVNYVKTGALLVAAGANGMQVSFELSKLAFVAGVSANLVHIRPQASSLTVFPYMTLSPNNRGTAFENPPRVWDLFNNPLPLLATEEFDIFATQNAGAAQTPAVFCQFSDGPVLPRTFPIFPPGSERNRRVPGMFLIAHATATTTLTANAWTAVTPAFDQTLPAGFYALLGMRAFSATGLWARIAPAMGAKWKPGGIAVQAYDQFDAPGQRAIPLMGYVVAPWGVWYQFYQNVPPNVEFFATAADAAEEIWFDLLFLGENMLQAA